jgi:hypothetical protein
VNRRSLFKRLGAAVAVAAVAPAMTVQAEPVCVECEQIRAHPVPLPDAFKPASEMLAALLEVAHVTAIRDGISHHAAMAFLAMHHMPMWYGAPSPQELDPEILMERPGRIEPMQPLGNLTVSGNLTVQSSTLVSGLSGQTLSMRRGNVHWVDADA